MKNLFFLLLLTIILKTGYSQNYITYYSAINEVRVLMIDSNYREAYEIIQTAFKNNESLAADDILAYKCAIYLKKYRHARKHIYDAIKKGYDVSWIEIDDNFRISKKKMLRLYNYYKSLIDMESTMDLMFMLPSDQSIRLSSLDNFEDSVIQNIYWSDSIFRNTYLELFYRSMRFMDSINYLSIISFIEERGLFEQKLHFHAFGVAELILAHSINFCDSYNNCEVIFEYLKRQVVLGNLEPDMFMRIFDRYYFSKHQCFYYGMYGGLSIELYEPENANKRRTNIGLPTFEQQERISGRKIIFKNFNNDFDN